MFAPISFSAMQTLTANKIALLRISIGILFIWFGALKFFQGQSPAEDLATQTISMLTFGAMPAWLSIKILAAGEVIIGALLVFNLWIKPAIIMAFAHLCFTFSALFAFPDISFSHPPFSFSLVGQYIMKNIVFLAALYCIYPTKKAAK